MQYQQDSKIILEDWLIQSSDSALADVLRRIAIAGKMISAKIRRASIEHLCGSTTITNYHGEEVKTLDIVSNDYFIHNLRKSKYVAALISEEDFTVIKTGNKGGKYTVTFDPLDGSSNIDANVNLGSIFGIYQTINSDEINEINEIDEVNYLKAGREMVGAGYILYGSSTILVVSVGTEGTEGGIHGFCLDDNIGEFILTHPNMRIPEDKNIYSINEGNWENWDERLVNLINYLKSTDKENNKKPYSQRYIGSMVADVHRTILYGGLFMYPALSNAPNGKLRYLYEVGPMSFLVEQAGGRASLGDIRALDYVPKTIHQRVPIFLGSVRGMDIVNKFLKS